MNLEALNWKLQSDDHFDDIKQRPSVTSRRDGRCLCGRIPHFEVSTLVDEWYLLFSMISFVFVFKCFCFGRCGIGLWL